MSKERELLERWAYHSGFSEYYTLREETETFLSQPESLREDLREDLQEDIREGISLRDHFAGLAMQGLLNGIDNYTTSTKATWAYNIADAMLAERSKRK